MSKQIEKILQDTRLFDHLSTQELSDLSAQIIIEKYPPNAIILKEGQIGDCLYILLNGSVRVYTYDKEGKEVVLARLEKGNYFGEQALLTESPLPRNASVRALTEVTAITISHAAFQNSLRTNERLLALLQEQGNKELITKLSKQLEDQKTSQKDLLTLFKDIKHFEKREVFFWQKDQPRYAYYLLRGEVEIRFYDEDNRIKSRSDIKPGQFFGELGVIENNPRLGTAVALTTAEVALVDATTLRDLYQRNINLHNLIATQLQIYHVPMMGLVTQYQDSFLNQTAVNTTIKKQNGDILTATRVIHADIFAVYYNQDTKEKRELFQDDIAHSREIWLADNKLVGVTSIGHWDDLAEIYQLVYEKFPLSPENLKNFQATGKLQIATKTLDRKEGNICECMQVKYQQIQDLMLRGITTLDEISKKTGAGTVCGGCRPRIIELLGGDAWTYVKIISVRKHNDHIRSYRLQPLNKKNLPYQAGQHIVIEANIDDLWIARAYTLTSIDTEKDYYEISVKREPLGLFSRWLFEHDTGTAATIRISAPQGERIFHPEKKEPTLCFMAGIGITPAIAFAQKTIATQENKLLYIDYSVQKENDLAFQEELTIWPKQHANIKIKVRITDEQGMINEKEIQDLTQQYPDADIFICGPKKYEDAISSVLKNIGISTDKIYLERFTHAGGPVNQPY